MKKIYLKNRKLLNRFVFELSAYSSNLDSTDCRLILRVYYIIHIKSHYLFLNAIQQHLLICFVDLYNKRFRTNFKFSDFLS